MAEPGNFVELPRRSGHHYQNIQIDGSGSVHVGDKTTSVQNQFINATGLTINSKVAARTSYEGQYVHTSLKPVKDFVSRPKLHHQIKTQLHDTLAEPENDETRLLVVNGLGGVGKSQLVLNYVQDYRRDYAAVFWIEAGQRETIERDYLQIYRLLFDVPIVNGQESVRVEDAVLGVKNWFPRQSRRWLFVFDGADMIDDEEDGSYIDLRYFLPDDPHLHIIITTRNAVARDMTSLEPVEVAELERPEAVELFRRSAKLGNIIPDVTTEVDSIVEELGCLALAIILAGSYVSATPRLRSNLKLYLPEYRQRRKHLLGQKPKRLIHQYGESVLTTWETTFGAIVRQNVEASRFMTLLAFLHFDDIFMDLFSLPRVFHGTERPASMTKSATTWCLLVSPAESMDIYEMEAIFRTLEIYSLVQWKQDQTSFAIHKLVHAWAHDRLSVEEQLTYGRAALQLLSTTAESCGPDVVHKSRLVPHVMANFSVVSTVYISQNKLDEQDLGFIAVIGDFLGGLGRWLDEHQVRSFHCRKSRETTGEEHPDTLTSMNNLAVVLNRQGKYEQAEEIHRRKLELTETALGTEHPSTLTSMNNLADILSEQGKYEQAEEIHRRTLELKQTALGTEHPSTLTSMNNLASVLSKQGKYGQAEEIHRRTLELIQTALGKEHPSTLTSMNNLANTYWKQKLWDKAETLEKTVLEVRSRILGQTHPATLHSMVKLAYTWKSQGRDGEAITLLRQAERLQKEVFVAINQAG